MLLSGDDGAWNRFYGEYRRKFEAYINQKYPGVFTDIAIEEIIDGVNRRLIDNNYKTLREYRGECTFSTYITKATEWEIKDWLRRHSDELLKEPIDIVDDHGATYAAAESHHQAHSAQLESDDVEIPTIVKTLSDELRWAFLLRYYDYFGFPFDEIRRLAKKRETPIGTITMKIIHYLEPEGEDVLRTQREKQKTLQSKLQKICYKLQSLSAKEHKLTESDENSMQAKRHETVESISEKRTLLEKKRKDLMESKAGFMVTTPYEIISEILGEKNVSTVRSRVFLAKKQLAQEISAGTKKHFE